MDNSLFGWAGQGSPVDVDVNTQLFTSSGTWVKPANCEWVRVILVGGGGGGGGGGKRQNISSATERPAGGGGGGGGGASFIDVPAGLLPNNVTITIGAGGTAGTGATADNGLGGAGGAGGTSTFGNILSALGGGAGSAGQGGGLGAVAGGNGWLVGGSSGYQSFGNMAGATRGAITGGGGNGGTQTDYRYINRASQGIAGVSPFLEPQKYGATGNGGQGGDFGIIASAESGGNGTFGCGGGGGGAVRTGVDSTGTTLNAGNGGTGGSGYCLIAAYSQRSKPINVQIFKSNGQWSKPTDPRLSTARVFAMGGGGGGGSGRQWSGTVGAYLTGSTLALSRTSGSYASSPNSAPLRVAGDIDIQVKVALWNWNNGPLYYNGVQNTSPFDRALVSKWTESGNVRSYMLSINEDGAVWFSHSADGTTPLYTTATQNLAYDSNTVKWIRATMQVNNGSAGRNYKFYTSDNGTTWTQLGTTITVAGTTSINAGVAPLNIGASDGGLGRLVDGNIYRAIIRNGYDGAGSVVFDADFSAQVAGTTSFAESSTNAATVTINSTTPTRTGGGGGSGGAISYSEIPLAALPATVTVTPGIGGAGGAAVTTAYTNGLNGSYGGRSTFGAYLSADGGERGFGGNYYAGAASTQSAAYGSSGSMTIGGIGGAGSSGAVGANSTATNTMTSGGGGGAGIATAGTTYAGGSSVVPTAYGTVLSAITAGLSGVSIFNADGMFGSTGGGGGSSSGTPTRDGGVGGRGSGGGGGAATTNGTTSGAGGSGGDGYVVVVCV